MAQVIRVLSGINRGDLRTLAVIEQLKRRRITSGEAREALFGFAKAEPSLCCFLLLVQQGNEFICQVIKEMMDGKVKLNFAAEEILALIDELCPSAVAKAILVAESRTLKVAA